MAQKEGIAPMTRSSFLKSLLVAPFAGFAAKKMTPAEQWIQAHPAYTHTAGYCQVTTSGNPPLSWTLEVDPPFATHGIIPDEEFIALMQTRQNEPREPMEKVFRELGI